MLEAAIFVAAALCANAILKIQTADANIQNIQLHNIKIMIFKLSNL